MLRRDLPILTAVSLAVFCLSPGAAHAAEPPVQLHGTLDGTHEVPPVQTDGKGRLEATLDRAAKTLTYSVTYQGLSGPATAAHFHGPADPGSNAGVVVPLQATSPIKGTATLTDQQMTDLLANKWYVNVHTQAHPGGEIRAQVLHGGP
jgi:hypothetical protein